MEQLLYFTRRLQSLAGPILYFNLIGMVLISLFEGVGILLLVPLINLSGLVEVDSQTTPALSWLSRLFGSLPRSYSLVIILSVFILIIVGQSFFQRKQTILNVKIQQGYIRHLREDIYKSLLQTNWEFFLNKRKSDLINLMTNEITLVSAGTNLFLQLLTSIVFTLIQLGIAFLLSIQLTLSVLIFGIGIILFSRRFINKSNVLGKETYQLTQAYTAGITDHFNGIKDIKSNMLEGIHIRLFNDLSEKMEKNRIELIKVNTISQFIYKVISAILIAFFMFFSIKIVNAKPAQLMLIVVIFSRLWPRFSGLQSNLEQLGSIIPSFNALLELQSKCKQFKEFDEFAHNHIEPFRIEKHIECKNVYFRYNSNQPVYALENINLIVPANKMTAIVGRSGAGKSTLIDLLMGLNCPESGQVLIDGNPLDTENLHSLRKSISYVPQDPFLFNGSIRENMFIIDPKTSEKEIWEALKFAAAENFVRNLPNGLDTLIGDRGVKLSGGERQRLVLARAVLRKPSILILDEATSALDTENETRIQEAIEELKGTMTVIVIAHRLSTIRNADQVVVLDEGKIIQNGQFNQLANEKRGLFSNLLEKQMGVSV
ncbi:ABC transporter ATP-binding protein [Bacillus sp. ISL-18]|uniref:ABC transporter ATP-binding protein n=1 Tax=Bacillus sp. ISL-18 TaxID=2819118 RepID=UPI001BEC8C1B|nr:ABC transporter ATP-binding protein [Bacillus sp. ISL-18]MBT2657075.1 ABC transporter ATP-binding protein [Bacillus sp. ISL-18]